MKMFLIDLRKKNKYMTNQFFPKKRLSRKQYKVAKHPWITPEILTAIKNKDKLYAKYLKEPQFFLPTQTTCIR